MQPLGPLAALVNEHQGQREAKMPEPEQIGKKRVEGARHREVGERRDLPRTPETYVPDDRELVRTVERRPGLSLKELSHEIWGDLPWRAAVPGGDSATERLRTWQVALRRGAIGNRVETLSAAAWLSDRMQDLVTKGLVRFGPLRRDEPDREAQVSYVTSLSRELTEAADRLGRSCPTR